MNEFQQILKEYPSVINKEQLRLLLHISKRKATYMLQNGFIPYEDTGKKTRNYFILLKDVIFYLEDVGAHPEKYVFPSGVFTANPAHQYIKNGECYYNEKCSWNKGCACNEEGLWDQEYGWNDGKGSEAEKFGCWLGEKWKRLPEKLTSLRIAQETGYSKKTVDRWFKEGSLKTVQLPGERVSCKEWLIEFYMKKGHGLARKSKKHIKLIERFFELLDEI